MVNRGVNHVSRIHSDCEVYMWSDEKAELRQNIKENLITAAEWISVWIGMFALLVKVIM